jgi:exopolysaccharide production protein ExoQ
VSEHRLVAVGTGRILQALVVVVAALSPLAPRAGTPALISGVVLIGCLYLVDRQRPPASARLPTIAFAALIVWCALSALWAEIAFSPLGLVELALLFAAGLLLVAWAGARRSERLTNGLVAGLGIALAIYLFEWISGDWLTRRVHGLSWRDILDPVTGGIAVEAYLINGTAILTLLLWPTAQLLLDRGRRLEAAVLTIGVLLATALYGSASSVIAFFCGLTAWAASMWKGARIAHGAAVLFAVVVLVSPLAIEGLLKPLDMQQVATRAEAAGLGNSTIVRLFIWRFAVERIAERPVFGWGFDASRRIPGGGDTFTVYGGNQDSGLRVLTREFNLPLHPHNQVLQVWLELGLVGALLAATFGFLILWRLEPVGLAVAVSALVFDYLSFGAWQSWWIAAVFIAAAFTAGTRRDSPDSAQGLDLAQ